MSAHDDNPAASGADTPPTRDPVTDEGLDILTSEDLVMGSSQMSFGDKQCVCDGAFSEAGECREQTDVLNHKVLQTAAFHWKPKGCPTAPVRYVTAPVLIAAGISNDERSCSAFFTAAFL